MVHRVPKHFERAKRNTGSPSEPKKDSSSVEVGVGDAQRGNGNKRGCLIRCATVLNTLIVVAILVFVVLIYLRNEETSRKSAKFMRAKFVEMSQQLNGVKSEIKNYIANESPGHYVRHPTRKE